MLPKPLYDALPYLYLGTGSLVGGALESSLKLMPTTEGSLDIEMNLTEAIDGYPGHEHSWPAFPLHSDMITLFAKSGIGLFAARRLMEAMGGRVWIERNGYGGSRFMVALPCA